MPYLGPRAETIVDIRKLLDVHDLACKPVTNALAFLEAELSERELQVLHRFVLEVIHRMVHNRELEHVTTGRAVSPRTN